jgi:8-oxo-dGTP pyrophosphatase MutT (NUDIX family)
MSAAPIVRSCNPTDPTKGGHALVIVHYLDTKTNTRTFFMGEESSYKERKYKNSSGKNVTERMRRFPPTVTNNPGRNAHAKANANFVSRTNHFVVRKNEKKGNYKYTIQVPNGIWGFPKGSGNEKDSKQIVIREFEEEVGYKLDDKRLVFKKCVEVARRAETTQSVVFHYELTNNTEVKNVKDAFAALDASGKGELFNAGFYTETEVKAKQKNKVSELAFADFAVDHSTSVDQTTIPRGGLVVSAAAPVAPVAAKYIPPHSRPRVVTAPSAGKITPGGGSRKSRRQTTRKRR